MGVEKEYNQMSSILVISTIYRCVERLRPLIFELATRHEVDIVHMGEMSPYSPWPGNLDLRRTFFNQCKERLRQHIPGKSRAFVETHYDDGPSLLSNVPDLGYYDLVLTDDNLCKKSWGFQAMYGEFKSHNIPVVSHSHGNREMNENFVEQNLGSCFDYSLVFGKKERDAYGHSKQSRRRLFLGGIPSNDVLKDYQHSEEYILIITNLTDPSKKSSLAKQFHTLLPRTFETSGILDVQQELGLPILVKEKSNFKKGHKDLESMESDDFNVVLDVDDDNEMLAKAKLIISAPSTLCFKAVQLGKPCVILRGFGMLGNFHDFRGSCKAKKQDVIQTVQEQIERGKDEEFVRNSVEGGVDFTSTQCSVDAVESLL